eukprot:gene5332-6650_t
MFTNEENIRTRASFLAHLNEKIKIFKSTQSDITNQFNRLFPIQQKQEKEEENQPEQQEEQQQNNNHSLIEDEIELSPLKEEAINITTSPASLSIPINNDNTFKQQDRELVENTTHSPNLTKIMKNNFSSTSTPNLPSSLKIFSPSPTIPIHRSTNTTTNDDKNINRSTINSDIYKRIVGSSTKKGYDIFRPKKIDDHSIETVVPPVLNIDATSATDLDDVFEEDISTLVWTRFVPFLIFAVVLSTSAIAIQYRNMSNAFNVPRLIYKIFAGISAGFWVAAAILTGYGLVKHKESKLNNLRDGTQVTVLGTVAMSLFQISSLAKELSLALAKVGFFISLIFQFTSLILLYIQVGIRLHRRSGIVITPTFFFSATGFLLAAYTSYDVGYQTFGWVLFGIGGILCVLIMIGFMVSNFLFGVMPIEAIPVQTIIVAFPSLLTTDLVFFQGRLRFLSRLLYTWIWADLLLVLLIWTIMCLKAPHTKLSFNLSWWGLSFPMISFGSASLVYYTNSKHTSTEIIAIFLVSISNFIYLVLLALTAFYLLTRNLFIPSKFSSQSNLSPK